MSDVVTFLITLQNSAMQRHFATQHWECLEMTLKWCEGNPDRQFQRLKTETCMQLFSFLFRSLAQNQLMASAEDSIIRFSSALLLSAVHSQGRPREVVLSTRDRGCRCRSTHGFSHTPEVRIETICTSFGPCMLVYTPFKEGHGMS